MFQAFRKTAQHYIQTKVPVSIYYNNELGFYMWSIQVKGTDFWIKSFKTKQAAISYCVKNDLPFTVDNNSAV